MLLEVTELEELLQIKCVKVYGHSLVSTQNLPAVFPEIPGSREESFCNPNRVYIKFIQQKDTWDVPRPWSPLQKYSIGLCVLYPKPLLYFHVPTLCRKHTQVFVPICPQCNGRCHTSKNKCAGLLLYCEGSGVNKYYTAISHLTVMSLKRRHSVAWKIPFKIKA